MIAHQRPRIPFYYWPLWMCLLALGLIVFYGIFTPAWMLVRFAAWVGEKIPRRASTTRPGPA